MSERDWDWDADRPYWVQRIKTLEAENARLRVVAEAAKALLDRIEVVVQDERYKAVWVIAQLLLGPYDGPQYKDQVDALRGAIMALKEADCGE